MFRHIKRDISDFWSGVAKVHSYCKIILIKIFKRKIFIEWWPVVYGKKIFIVAYAGVQS